MNPPGNDPIEREKALMEYLQFNLVNVGWLCWVGWLRLGRGVLMIVADAHQAEYKSLADYRVIMAQTHPEQVDPMIAHLKLEEYDPDKMFFVHFAYSDWPTALITSVEPGPPIQSLTPMAYLVSEVSHSDNGHGAQIPPWPSVQLSTPQDILDTIRYDYNGLPFYYTLDERRRPIPATLRQANELLADGERRQVGFDHLGRAGYVSTVFLVLDHSFMMTGGPVLFETMVFGGKYDGWQTRCTTWADARYHHRAMVALVASRMTPLAKRLRGYFVHGHRYDKGSNSLRGAYA